MKKSTGKVIGTISLVSLLFLSACGKKEKLSFDDAFNMNNPVLNSYISTKKISKKIDKLGNPEIYLSDAEMDVDFTVKNGAIEINPMLDSDDIDNVVKKALKQYKKMQKKMSKEFETAQEILDNYTSQEHIQTLMDMYGDPEIRFSDLSGEEQKSSVQLGEICLDVNLSADEMQLEIGKQLPRHNVLHEKYMQSVEATRNSIKKLLATNFAEYSNNFGEITFEVGVVKGSNYIVEDSKITIDHRLSDKNIYLALVDAIPMYVATINPDSLAARKDRFNGLDDYLTETSVVKDSSLVSPDSSFVDSLNEVVYKDSADAVINYTVDDSTNVNEPDSIKTE